MFVTVKYLSAASVQIANVFKMCYVGESRICKIYKIEIFLNKISFSCPYLHDYIRGELFDCNYSFPIE